MATVREKALSEEAFRYDHMTGDELEDAVGAWRADTPGCSRVIHFNNAGAALMPLPVVRAVRQHLKAEAWVGGYEAADLRSDAIRGTYASIAALLNTEAKNIALTASATAGFVQTLSSFDFRPGDVIVTTNLDYTSYQIQLLALAKRAGVRVVHAENDASGGADVSSVRELARHPRCRLVTVSWIPTHSGIVQDVEAIGAVCDDLGVPYHIDACQAVGQLPVDVQRLRCDYLSGTGRKFLRGPRGTGFLYASDRALARGDYPLFIDMRGATWVSEEAFEIQPTAQRYEEWEFPWSLMLGLGEAVRYANEIGVSVAGRRAVGLARMLREQLSAIGGVRLLEPVDASSAIVTIAIDRLDAVSMVEALRKRGINTAASLGWFGLRDFGRRKVDDAVRLSPHYYNTAGEVAEAAQAIADVVAGASTLARS